MKNKILILTSIILSVFLFGQYLYSHWPTLEVKESITYEPRYTFDDIPLIIYGFKFCDFDNAVVKEKEVINYYKIYDTGAIKSIYGGDIVYQIPGVNIKPPSKMMIKYQYIPCYKETKIRHWENLWK